MRVFTCRSIFNLVKLNSIQTHSIFGGIIEKDKLARKLLPYCTITNNSMKIKQASISKEIENVDDNLGNFADLESSIMIKNVLEPPSIPEEVDVIRPPPLPINSFSSYADKSETLQKLIQLGVNVGKWNEHIEKMDFIVNLDFEKDISPYIFLLHHSGVPVDDMGKILTKNPFIFLEKLETIAVRINYLQSKKFTKENIGRIIKCSPRWLNQSVLKIDQQLGIFQKMFNLTGDEIRSVVVTNPRLIIGSMLYRLVLEGNNLLMRNEMCFNNEQMKTLLLTRPRIFMEKPDDVMERFNFITMDMGLDCNTIVKNPIILLLRKRKLEERHGFLAFLEMDQYDPSKPNFISPTEFCLGNDEKFVNNVAKTEQQMYKDYLKTL